MRRKGQGSASISAVVVFLSAMLALGLMATILPPVADVLSGFREGLRERGERGSELIRIYIHTVNETENEPPIITIINGYDKESILTDYVVVARDGRVLAAGKMGGSLGGIRIPAGARIDLTPADFGLSYGTFAAMADEVKAIYVRTAEGNSFGSSYGPPPKVSVDYQLNISKNTRHIIVIGITTTRHNFTIVGTLPTLGDALVVKNVILVDKDGYVRGGVTAGSKWSDGSFDPNKIPDSVAALTFTDVVPINGYYAVPPFPTIPGCENYGNGFWVYDYNWSCREVRPQFIERVEFYPVEYYTPGSPVAATMYYARYGGEAQTVYNPDLEREVVITAQRPVTFLKYPYKVPGTYTVTFLYKTTTGTRTITSTIITPVTVWQEEGPGPLLIAPASPRYLDSEEREGSCDVVIDGAGGTKNCSFRIVAPSRLLVPVSIKEVRLKVTYGFSGTCDIKPFPKPTIVVNVTGPWGTDTIQSNDPINWQKANLPYGSVTFDLQASRAPCGGLNTRVVLRAWVVYEFWRIPAATATLESASVAYLTIPTLTTTTTRTITYYTSVITYGTITTYTETYYGCPSPWYPGTTVTCTTTTTTITRTLYTVSARTDRQAIDIAEQMKRAFVNGTETLSGDAVAHLAGTVREGQIFKVKAPLVLLNYIYGIATSPPTPPSSGGGGSLGYVGLNCETEGTPILRSDTSSSDSSTNEPLESISGRTVPNFSVQERYVTELRSVVCRPVTPPRSLPSPA